MSLRLASCCSDAVVNGAEGDLSLVDVLMSETLKGFPLTRETTSSASCRVLSSFFSPFIPQNWASKRVFPLWNAASISQYSSGMKASISSSRSTTSRVATLCTRPADRPFLTLAQSMGLIL